MSLLIAGSVIGGIVLYNNSDDIMLETLRIYTNIQEYLNKNGFLKQKQQDTFEINKNKINKYVCNDKEFYTINNQTKPSQNMLNEYSLQLNPILSVTLKINNSNYEVINNIFCFSSWIYVFSRVEL